MVARRNKKIKSNYVVLEYKQKVKVKGQGEYEVTVKNLVNPLTLKSITPGESFLKRDYVKAIQIDRMKKKIRFENRKILSNNKNYNGPLSKEQQELRKKKTAEARKTILPKVLLKLSYDK